MEEKKELFDWLWERKFTMEEIKDLVERIKQFNCGAIDEYLTRHADRVLEDWLQEKR